MRSITFTALALFLSSFLYAQPDSLQKQINAQVWKPFIESFGNRDTEGFMAVHSKEMSRVLQDDGRMYGYETYYQETKRGNERGKAGNWKLKIELRFKQRIAGEGRGFEVGYYKTTSIAPDGAQRSFYGKFHVLLRKENGVWKILMDADANEKTDEAVFMTGKPLE